jgi:hypothetical protein
MIRKFAVAGLVALVELVLACVIVRLVLDHTSTETQLAVVAGVVIATVFGHWQRGRTARAADQAAALARLAQGTGTYILQFGKGAVRGGQLNHSPLDTRLGLELKGIQPNAVQTYPDGSPIHREPDVHEQALAAAEAANPTPKLEAIPAVYQTAAELGLEDVGAAAADSPAAEQ